MLLLLLLLALVLLQRQQCGMLLWQHVLVLQHAAQRKLVGKLLLL